MKYFGLLLLLMGCNTSSAQNIERMGMVTVVHYRLFGGMPEPLRELSLDVRTLRLTGISRTQNGGRTFGATQNVDRQVTRQQASVFATYTMRADFLPVTCTGGGPVGRTEFLELVDAHGRRVRVGAHGGPQQRCATRGERFDQLLLDRFVALANVDAPQK